MQSTIKKKVNSAIGQRKATIVGIALMLVVAGTETATMTVQNNVLAVIVKGKAPHRLVLSLRRASGKVNDRAEAPSLSFYTL